MPDWETVREIATKLPEVEEHALYGGHPALRVRGKLFAWMSPKREAEGVFVLRVDRDEKRLILESNPDVYFETPHYSGYPAVLVNLDRIDREELVERIEDAWLIQAPKRLAAQYRDGSSPGRP
ncbi:MAG TPA: MmcQ/YjbR family DNA-binding protein [Gaiellaceae bacterium]|nr:MmcQ/YjbR family DNA-binding protein [Gaiellaceae bacterium]